jgi:hypothetical protein
MDHMTALLIVHLIGMAFGIGASVVGDYIMMQAILKNKITEAQVEQFKLIGTVVTVGLCLLLLSGIGFLTSYVINSPELLANPKLWAKLTIVVILAFNGTVLHQVVIPFLQTRTDSPFLTGKVRSKAHVMMTAGAVSVTSWYSVLLLGAWSGLNFQASYTTIFGTYCVILALAIITANGMVGMLLRRPAAKHAAA